MALCLASKHHVYVDSELRVTVLWLTFILLHLSHVAVHCQPGSVLLPEVEASLKAHSQNCVKSQRVLSARSEHMLLTIDCSVFWAEEW